MPSGQNKTIRLYGPWRGVADSDGEGNMGAFEVGFNLCQDGEFITNRGGTVPYSTLHSAVATARRLHSTINGDLLVAGNGAVTIDYGSLSTALTTDGAFTNGGLGKQARIGQFTFILDDDGVICGVDEAGGTANKLVPLSGTEEGIGYYSALPAFVAIEAYEERLFGVTATGTVVASEVYGRVAFLPDGAVFGGLNLWQSGFDFDIGPSTAGYGLKTMGGYLAVFSSKRVGLFSVGADVASTAVLQDVPTGHGCIAPESIALSPRGVIYLAPDGVRVLSGATSTLVSEGVSETIRKEIPTGGFSPCVGVCLPSQKHYRLFIPVRESTVAQMAIVWDYETGEWFMWGTQPPWAAQDGYYAVTSAVVLPSVSSDERLVTTAPGRVSFIHDVGTLDCIDSSSAGREISWFLAFKPIGFGEDQGVATWRDLRIEAKSDATHIRVAFLTDGEKFEEGIGSETSTLASYPYVLTTITNQSTWTSTAPADAELYTGSLTASVPRWVSWRVPSAKVARTLQVVLWNGLVTDATTRTPGIVSIRGVELEARQKRGRR